MKKFQLLLICISFYNFSFGQITFNKQFDYDIDAGVCVKETNNGYIFPYVSYVDDFFMPLIFQKINFQGDTVFRKVIGVPNNHNYYIIYTIEQVNDSNYVLGSYNRDSLYYANIFLMKTNGLGDSLWTKNYHPDTAFSYGGTYMINTSDGGFLVCGEKYDTAYVDGDGYLLKADSMGNFQWDNHYGGSRYDALYSAIELPDKGFLGLGWTRSFGFGNISNRDVYLIRTDSIGNLIWQKTYGNSDNETGIGISETYDKNFLIAGYKVINNITENAWLLKIDSAGNVIWQYTYLFESNVEIWWARELADHSIICAGGNYNFSNISGGIIFKVDSSGVLQWYRAFYFGNNHAVFRDVHQTFDGGFICPGFVYTGPSGNQDAWLVKVDSLGCDSDGCAGYTGVDEVPVKNYDLTVYPNPATNMVFVKLKENRNADNYEISVYNAQGAGVFKRRFLNTGNADPVFISSFPKGLYLLRCEVAGKLYATKIIKE